MTNPCSERPEYIGAVGENENTILMKNTSILRYSKKKNWK
jgi:hypothetical protein